MNRCVMMARTLRRESSHAYLIMPPSESQCPIGTTRKNCIRRRCWEAEISSRWMGAAGMIIDTFGVPVRHSNDVTRPVRNPKGPGRNGARRRLVDSAQMGIQRRGRFQIHGGKHHDRLQSHATAVPWQRDHLSDRRAPRERGQKTGSGEKLTALPCEGSLP